MRGPGAGHGGACGGNGLRSSTGGPGGGGPGGGGPGGGGGGGAGSGGGPGGGGVHWSGRSTGGPGTTGPGGGGVHWSGRSTGGSGTTGPGGGGGVGSALPIGVETRTMMNVAVVAPSWAVFAIMDSSSWFEVDSRNTASKRRGFLIIELFQFHNLGVSSSLKTCIRTQRANFAPHLRGMHSRDSAPPDRPRAATTFSLQQP